MTHKTCWPLLVGDTLVSGVSAAVPEWTVLGLLMFALSLLLTMAPAANHVASWWSKSLLGD